jgi:hypothetical protein
MSSGAGIVAFQNAIGERYVLPASLPLVLFSKPTGYPRSESESSTSAANDRNHDPFEAMTVFARCQNWPYPD